MFEKHYNRFLDVTTLFPVKTEAYFEETVAGFRLKGTIILLFLEIS